MSLIAKATGSDMEPITPGMHPAVCYGVVDLGTQPAFGQFPPKRKVLFLFELPLERGEFERDGKMVSLPRAISVSFTLSLHKKGNLRPALESWRGREFTDKELQGFDVMACIGANALLNITHRAGAGKNAGRTFADIKAICPLPKGTAKRQLENPPLKFSLDDVPPRTQPTKPDAMPDWIWARITQSDEYIHRVQDDGVSTPTDEAEQAAIAANLSPEADGEDVPF